MFIAPNQPETIRSVGPACQPLPSLRSRPSRASGFSLIELIGVLAVIAIMAAILYPVVIRRIDIAAKEREGTDLVAISNALVLQVLAKKTVPTQANWPAEIAEWTRLPVSKITTTPRRYTRKFFLDSSGWLGTTALPYVQANNGTTPPNNARIIVVSSVTHDLVALPNTITPTEFDKVWKTARDAKPNTTTITFPGRGENLLIQRISLDTLFHNLTLVNRDTNVLGKYSIQPDNNIAALPATYGGASVITRAYLDGTDLRLRLQDDAVQEVHLLTRDQTFVFNGNRWGGEYYGPGSEEELSQGFAFWAEQFRKAGASPTASQGARPESAIVAMYNFMLIFGLWANKCDSGDNHFPTYGLGPDDKNVPEYLLLLDASAGDNDNSWLSSFSGVRGLLNVDPTKVP